MVTSSPSWGFELLGQLVATDLRPLKAEDPEADGDVRSVLHRLVTQVMAPAPFLRPAIPECRKWTALRPLRSPPLIDPQPSAPPVVAVVVTCDPGSWLEETLTTLGAQDYPNLSVLVIDAASTEDPTPRVAAVLPRAYVYRLPSRVGFARAANEALSMVEGASHFLFCHDDVALAPDAVRILLEEAFRTTPAWCAPKLVEWDRPERLISVGLSADKTGVTAAWSSGASSTRSSTTRFAMSSAPLAAAPWSAPTCSPPSAATTPDRPARRGPQPVLAGPGRSEPGSSWRPGRGSATVEALAAGERAGWTARRRGAGRAAWRTPIASAPCSSATAGST